MLGLIPAYALFNLVIVCHNSLTHMGSKSASSTAVYCIVAYFQIVDVFCTRQSLYPLMLSTCG